MRSTLSALLAAAVALAAIGCDNSGKGVGTDNSLALGTAFSSLPVAYSNTDNTFPASADMGEAWEPMGHERGPRGMGFGGMLGGGMRDGFLGRGFGFGFGHGFFGLNNLSSCTYAASTGTFTCPAATFNGITVTRTVKLQDKSGNAQSAYDTATTNTITENVTVTGSFTMMRHDSATTTVSHNSTRTVSGLAKGSTQRTINGTSAGTETTVGKDTAGTFTVARTAGDTTKNVVIPVPATDTSRTYPTAGTIIRVMQISVTRTGQTPTSASRREVVTYNGTATATVVITENGTTKTCSLPLPFGRPTCQ